MARYITACCLGSRSQQRLSRTALPARRRRPTVRICRSSWSIPRCSGSAPTRATCRSRMRRAKVSKTSSASCLRSAAVPVAAAAGRWPGMLRPSRCVADRWHQLQSGIVVPRLPVLQAAPDAEETLARRFLQPLLGQPALPVRPAQSENSFASSTHSPCGASDRYAVQCGRASCDSPIFSKVTAR